MEEKQFIKQWKQSNIKIKLLAIWKLIWIIPIYITLFLFLGILIIFNLSIEESKECYRYII
jgi:hypothetical protein